MNRDFVLKSFAHPAAVLLYSGAVSEIGLWKSEKMFFAKHLPRGGRILDLGCGPGRTTFGLYAMGYENIIGVDISPAMIRQARLHAARRRSKIQFRVEDACRLSFESRSFDAGLFSFNGLMQIPERRFRVRALREIRRILVPGGRFVFTTHDRLREARFRPLWRKERARWRAGNQDPRLDEFGDGIFEDRRSSGQSRQMFIHIPDRREILECLRAARLEWIEDEWRSDLARESKAVKEFSAECRFWAARKPMTTIVRRAKLVDAVRIRNVHVASIRGLCARDYTPAQIRAWTSHKRAESVRRAMAEGETMFLALEGNRTVGFAGFKDREVRAVYVHPGFARRGIGTALLAALERTARRRGLRRVHLSSSVTAAPFYRAMGFATVRKSRFTLRDGTRIACVLMRKSLHGELRSLPQRT